MFEVRLMTTILPRQRLWQNGPEGQLSLKLGHVDARDKFDVTKHAVDITGRLNVGRNEGIKRKKVAILAFDGISAFHLSVPCLVFNDAFVDSDKPFETRVCSWQGETLKTASNFQLTTFYGLEELEQADIVIIPSWADIDVQPPAMVLDALQRAYDHGATIAGLCLGAFVLASTGLLDGLSATTHWAYADEFARQFPQVKCDPEPLFIEHGRLITSAGTAAALDCCLHMVRKEIGSEATSQLARTIVTAPYRHGGQKQYIPTPVPEVRRLVSGIGEVMEQVLQELDKPHSVDSMAERCVMSRRTFTRQFKSLTGVSFVEWLTSQRLNYSQQLLEHSSHSIVRIAELSGFGSESVYRKHFKQAYNVSPSQWRANFTARTE
jgi:transcriptional regulator GlxA family with amidase domain